MTYRELLDIYTKSRNRQMNGIPVRFKESPSVQSEEKLPVAGMVANIVFIHTSRALDELPGPIESWKDAPASILVEAIEFDFRGFEAHNAGLDTYDPGANYRPWLVDACDSNGTFIVEFNRTFGENALLNDEVDWFDIISPESIHVAEESEIESAKRKNCEAVNALRKYIVDTVSSLDKADPGFSALMDFASKTDDKILNLIDRLY